MNIKKIAAPGNGNGIYRQREVNNNSANIKPESISNEVNTLASSEPESKGVYSANELLSRGITKIPTLLDPLFPRVGLIAVAGSSDTGKSSFLRQFVISVVVGDSDFLGFNLTAKHQRAIYVSTEDDDFAVSFLLSKANNSRRLHSDAYSGLTFIFDTENILFRLEYELKERPSDVVIVDAFTDLYGKSMNDSNQVRTFLNDFSQLAQKHKCLIIFLHHTGKRTEELTPSKNNLLGSQGFEAKMRMVAELRTDQIESALRHLCIVKGNYLSKEYKTESYVLNFDENLQFSFTGDRVPFDELKSERKQDLQESVLKLKTAGKTQIEISKQLGISQSTVSRYLK